MVIGSLNLLISYFHHFYLQLLLILHNLLSFVLLLVLLQLNSILMLLITFLPYRPNMDLNHCLFFDLLQLYLL